MGKGTTYLVPALDEYGRPIEPPIRTRYDGKGPFHDEVPAANPAQQPAKRRKRNPSPAPAEPAAAAGAAQATEEPAVVSLGPATAATKERVFAKGERLHAVYPEDGKLYPAVVAQVHRSQGVVVAYTVDWEDGTTEYRRRKKEDVLATDEVLIDTTFFKTPEALKAYIKSLDRTCCKNFCQEARLRDLGDVARLRERLCTAVDDNFGLMQLATVCYCWGDLKTILASDLQTDSHPDSYILDSIPELMREYQESLPEEEKTRRDERYPPTLPRWDMVTEGKLPRFVVRLPILC